MSGLKIVVEFDGYYDWFKIENIGRDIAEKLDICFDACTMNKAFFSSMTEDRRKAKGIANVIAVEYKKHGYKVKKTEITFYDLSFIQEQCYEIIDLQELVKRYKEKEAKAIQKKQELRKKIDEIISLIEKLRKATRSKKAHKIIFELEMKIKSLKWVI